MTSHDTEVCGLLANPPADCRLTLVVVSRLTDDVTNYSAKRLDIKNFLFASKTYNLQNLLIYMSTIKDSDLFLSAEICNT